MVPHSYYIVEKVVVENVSPSFDGLSGTSSSSRHVALPKYRACSRTFPESGVAQCQRTLDQTLLVLC